MSDGDRRIIEWHASAEGGPLGRHVNHDPRNRQYPARRATRRSVTHRIYGPVLDQDNVVLPTTGKVGSVGGCTGFSLATTLNTTPVRTPKVIHANADGLALYERATVLDGFPGSYPPHDTGSDGGSAAKAAVEKGWITGYAWAFGIDHVLDALVLAAFSIGTEWPGDFDTPDSAGRVRLAVGWDKRIRGGHQYTLRGLHVPDKTCLIRNTWGSGYGKGGEVEASWADLAALLDAQGDATTVSR